MAERKTPPPDDPFYYIYQDLISLDEEKGKGGGSSGGGNSSNSGLQSALKNIGGKDSLGNNPKEYSDIGPKQGSVLPAGDQGNGATTTPVNFNDGGITTQTFDGSGNMVSESTSTGTGSSSGDSGGSWVGAVIGAIRGYQAGKKNYEEDPAMKDGKDGFGKHHKDYRAEVGGTVGGGFLGYYGGAGVSDKAVEWSHPFMQDATRDTINFGDKVGDAYGAMSLDPIGTIASGKYSNTELAKSAVAGPLARYWKADGGKIDGPGTKTSDSIPARLSDGEYVLNAEAVELIGEDTLDKINAAGLRQRGHAGRTRRGHFANGGAMNRGGWNSFNQGLQSGYEISDKYRAAKEREEIQKIMNDPIVDQQAAYDNYNQQIAAQDRATFGEDVPAVDGAGKAVGGYRYNGQTLQQRPTDAQLNALKMNRLADYYASQGQPEKALQMRGQAMQLEEASAQMEQRQRERSFVSKWQERMARAEKDPVGVIMEIHPEYQADQGPYADGHEIRFSSTPQGTLATRVNKQTGEATGSQLLTPELAKQALVRAYQMERAHLSLDQNDKVFDREMKQGGLDVQRQQATTTEGYRRDLANRPHYVQDGTGRVLEFGPQGGLRGTYGDSRPPALGSGANRGPSEMSIDDRIKMNAAIEERAQLEAADDGKSWKKLDAGQKEEYRRAAAGALGFDVSPRVKGLQGQPAPGAPAPLVVPKAYTEEANAGGGGGLTPSRPKVISMEPAGTSWGSQQYVVTYEGGRRELVSGDEAKRMYILNSQ